MARRGTRRSQPTTRFTVTVPVLAWCAAAVIGLVAPRVSADATCNEMQSGSYQSLLAIPPCGGVSQPLVDGGNLVGIQLQVWGDSLGVLRVLAWNPISLLPDSTSVPLLEHRVSPDELAAGSVDVALATPLVLRNAPHLADSRTNYALDYTDQSTADHRVGYENDADARVPGALQYFRFNARGPLPGPHPVLAHQVCAASDSDAGLTLAQSVMTTDVVFDTLDAELIQRFQVSVPIRLRNIEAVIQPLEPVVQPRFAIVAVIDTPSALPPETARSKLFIGQLPCDPERRTADWVPTLDYSHPEVLLEPHHDYWLLVRRSVECAVLGRGRRAVENADFLAGVGPCYGRATDESWSERSDRTLSFRVIGEPLDPAVSVASAATPRLALGVTPQPARGDAWIQWNGGWGQVRLTVLDLDGRRVCERRSEGDGRWRWSAFDARGRRLAAGVYFVRAEDDRGNAATVRLVLVR